LHALVEELGINFQDGCIGTCVMADFCRTQFRTKARVLGDDVSALLGPDIEITRVIALISGARAISDRERQIVAQMREAMNILPRLRQEVGRRIA
jgi:hypothetical protein